MLFAFDAYVAAALFLKEGAAFALGDGTVRFEGGETVQAHDGAVLCAAAHPSGFGLVTGGDDGRVVWSRPAGAAVIADLKGRWIDAIDAHPASGLIAFSAGRDLHVRDAADPALARVFKHERSVAAVAFDPKGRRIAAATYGGAALWYARIAEQKPQMLKWAGSHIGLIWSPDGRFLMSSMQESALHGWRIADAKDMRMGGYPAKVKSFAFLSKGMLLVTSGAQGAVVWPFGGANGPMGKQAAEIGYDQSAMVVRVAAQEAQGWVIAGLDDGRVWAAQPAGGGGLVPIKSEKGAPISALSLSRDGGRVAWGDEAGGAGVAALTG
jgi:WD40 repeat protein